MSELASSPSGQGNLGALFHLIHLTGDIDGLERWYGDLVAPEEFLPRHYLEGEKRHASLLAFADCVVEPMSPAFGVAGWEGTPIGRSFRRTGPRWHSLALYAKDPAALARRCLDHGVRVYGMDGPVAEPVGDPGTVFTHPRDTLTQLQFTRLDGSRYAALDPRLRPGYDPGRWAREPLGVRGLDHVCVVCPDLDAALRRYVDGLGAEPVRSGGSALTGTRDAVVRLGEVTVVLSAPTGADGLAAGDLRERGPGLHAVGLRVVDLDRAATHLRGLGVRELGRDDTTLLTDPATTGGVAFRWVEAS